MTTLTLTLTLTLSLTPNPNPNPNQVRAMVGRANAATNLATSVAGMRYYVKELLASYTQALTFEPRTEPRAVLFQCRPTKVRVRVRVRVRVS